MTHDQPVCPRCRGPLGQDPARSRLTLARTIPICALCGSDEALRDARGQAPQPPGEWPVAS